MKRRLVSALQALWPALASALLFAATLPPFDQRWLAWLWLLPLLVRLWSARENEARGARRFWRGFGYGWLCFCALFLSTLWWLAHVTLPGMIALCLYLAVFPALWTGFAALLRPSSPARAALGAIALAWLWAGLEWARGSVPVMGFPWNGAGVPLVDMPGIRSLAAVTGVTGLSMLPVFFMAGLAGSWALRRHRSARGRALLMAATMAPPAALTLATWQPLRAPVATIDVMLVQPNVPMREKMDPQYDEDRYRDLVELTLLNYPLHPRPPQLVAWPESAIPGYFHDREHDDYLNTVLAAGPLTLVTGADALTADGAGDDSWDGRNCAAVMRGTRDNFLLHAKVHLVPFGEYIPLRGHLPFLEDMLGELIPNDFAAGTSVEPLRMDGLPCGLIPLICFEDTIGALARQFVRDEPQLLLNITNDNWFHDSNESAIHALNARWRCIELQRPMIRAANTGVTCVIDPEGRVTDELPRWQQGVLHAAVPVPGGGITFYAARGDVVSITALVAGLVLAVAILATSRRAAP